MPGGLDLIDRKILSELMHDATLPVARIADRVGLSQTPCWKRIQRLEATGVITGRVAIVDPVRIGLMLTVHIGVVAPDQSTEWRDRFRAVAAEFPEVLEAHRTTGEPDYLLRVAVADMTALDAFYRRLTDRIAIKSLTTHVTLERLKFGTAYPVDTDSY